MTTLTTLEFRKNVDYVAHMRQLIEGDDIFRLWLGCMDNENPAKRLVRAGQAAHDHSLMLGEQTGWQNYRDRFLNCAVPPPQKVDDAGPQDYSMSADDVAAEPKS